MREYLTKNNFNKQIKHSIDLKKKLRKKEKAYNSNEE